MNKFELSLPLNQLPMAFFGIGIENFKTDQNIGTLWRSASIMKASFIFTIGKQYKIQATDTAISWKHIPLYNYENFEAFYKALPYDCQLVGVEMDEKSVPVAEFVHPPRCVYLLGSEDNGLSKTALEKCHKLVQLPGDHCMNVAVAGSIIMYDRSTK